MTDVQTIRDIGERSLLDRILPLLPAGTAQLGPGDDAAVFTAGDGRLVVTCDTLIEGPDFRNDWSTPRQLGYKSIVVNLADVAAMGARPTGIVMALAAPNDTPVTWVEELCRGMRDALSHYAPDAGVVGGDLATAERTTIAITAFGSLDGGDAVTRSGASPGDILAIAGDMGRAAAGLELCFNTAREDWAHCTPEQQALIAAQLAPTPPLQAGIIARASKASAMMDVSDGLLLDAHRLAEASGVQLNLHTSDWANTTDRLAAELGSSRAHALHLELTGGEDHALLATFPATGDALPHPFRMIGTVSAADVPGVTVDGEAASAKGWDPYAAGSIGATSR